MLRLQVILQLQQQRAKDILLNTTAGAIATVNLPAGAAGSIVSISDYTATFNAYNNVTVSANGSEKNWWKQVCEL